MSKEVLQMLVLNVTANRPVAGTNNVKNPNEVYIVFDKGHYIWDWLLDKSLVVWYGSYRFEFNDDELPAVMAAKFNEWVEHVWQNT
jgi:hypothetical protein